MINIMCPQSSSKNSTKDPLPLDSNPCSVLICRTKEVSVLPMNLQTLHFKSLGAWCDLENKQNTWKIVKRTRGLQKCEYLIWRFTSWLRFEEKSQKLQPYIPGTPEPCIPGLCQNMSYFRMNTQWVNLDITQKEIEVCAKFTPSVMSA